MADSFAQMERGLRSFYNKLQTHNLGEGIIALSEESTMVLRNLVCAANPSIIHKVHSSTIFNSNILH